jgi:two-component system, OmpR family, KDP operon response regulator KdpE
MSMPTRGDVQRIVVADDDLFLTDVLASALHAHGYEVVRAPNGIISAALTADTNLVILDAHIPGTDFESTLRLLRDSAVGVLVLSGELSPPNGVAAEEYLGKPVELDRLLQAVDRLATRTSVS